MPELQTKPLKVLCKGSSENIPAKQMEADA